MICPNDILVSTPRKQIKYCWNILRVCAPLPLFLRSPSSPGAERPRERQAAQPRDARMCDRTQRCTLLRGCAPGPDRAPEAALLQRLNQRHEGCALRCLERQMLLPCLPCSGLQAPGKACPAQAIVATILCSSPDIPSARRLVETLQHHHAAGLRGARTGIAPRPCARGEHRWRRPYGAGPGKHARAAASMQTPSAAHAQTSARAPAAPARAGRACSAQSHAMSSRRLPAGAADVTQVGMPRAASCPVQCAKLVLAPAVSL